jgi:hypothetical protein
LLHILLIFCSISIAGAVFRSAALLNAQPPLSRASAIFHRTELADIEKNQKKFQFVFTIRPNWYIVNSTTLLIFYQSGAKNGL